MTTEIDAEGLRYPMAKRSAYWTFDEKSAETVGNLYYFAPLDRAPPPYLTQRHVEAIIDIAADGTLAGVELIDNMPPPPRATTRTSEAEPVAWMAVTPDGDEHTTMIKALADGLVKSGWTITPLYAKPHPTPASDDQVEAVTDEMVERAALALAKRNDVPQWREFIPDARAALLAAMGVPSHEHDAGELADAYRDLAARQTDTEPDIAKVVRDNRSKLYMPLDDATVRSGEEG